MCAHLPSAETLQLQVPNWIEPLMQQRVMATFKGTSDFIE